MKTILLGAKGIPSLPSNPDIETSLAWIINSLKGAGIDDISIVSGKSTADITKSYRDLNIIYNKNWKDTGPLESLLLCKDLILESDIMISYADVVYSQKMISDLLNNIDNSPISIISDNNWINRYTRSKDSIKKAEKIWLDEFGNVQKVSRGDVITNKFQSEYTGICYIKKEFCSEIISISKYLVNKHKEMSESEYPIGFRDLFNEILKRGHKITNHNTNGHWAELDVPEDFNNFIFGTKSRTLSNLKGQLKNGKILTQISFDISEWKKNEEDIIVRIQKHFRSKELIVRSSSLAEDSFESSSAGKFTSLIGIDRDSSISIKKAVEEVIDSYGKTMSMNDIVFVQPVLPKVISSGVLFTCDLKTGAPYYCANWTKSGSTDIVTSGIEGEYNLYYHLKSNNLPKDRYMKKLIRCAMEIEKLVKNKLLDIEFAFNFDDELYIFQVRPIASSTAIGSYGMYETSTKINKKLTTLKDIFSPRDNVSGRTTVLGNMPDWNPAELIGTRPRTLSSTLFHRLITKRVWRLARKNIGYYNPPSEELLVMIFGQPFIDVRNSLNSFTPSNLSKSLRAMLVDESIDFLKTNPHLHDKLEFEVATTCYTPYFNDRIERWKKFGFKDRQIDEMAKHFRKQTEDIVNSKWANSKDLINEVKNLDNERRIVLKSKGLNRLSKANKLISLCENRGTTPFSTLARFAFVGNTFLKSFVNNNIISEKSYNLYLNSIETIATEMMQELDDLRSGEASIEKFLYRFGHLRPGTFDITSFRYDERPELYFDFEEKSEVKPEVTNHFSFSNKDKSKINSLLKELDLGFDNKILFNFIKESIKGREYSKFLFSRSISDALKLINSWGKDNGISREDLSYVDFNLLMKLDFDIDKENSLRLLRQHIKSMKYEFEFNQHIIIPELVKGIEDLVSFHMLTNKPNFVTNSNVTGKIIKLDSNQKEFNISKKIVLIESADPGYDWIFTHNIIGLITKYGGAASHMTIRCSEFNLPAAIGCGNIFDTFSSNDKIIMDCSNQTIKKV